jgi:hypothetical protein
VDVGDGHPPRVSPRWVVERVNCFYHIVGLSCEGYDDKMMALFEEIVATRDQTMAEDTTSISSTQGQKVNRN